jgi:hypothetical protein
VSIPLGAYSRTTTVESMKRSIPCNNGEEKVCAYAWAFSHEHGILFYMKQYDTRMIQWAGVIGLIALGGVNAFAMHVDLYWIFSWFDIAMHTFGGIVLSWCAYAFLLTRFSFLSPKNFFWYTLSIVLVLAFGWEIFEFTLDEWLRIQLQGPLSDTVSDLLFGMLGALGGYVFAKYLLITHKHSTL